MTGTDLNQIRHESPDPLAGSDKERLYLWRLGLSCCIECGRKAAAECTRAGDQEPFHAVCYSCAPTDAPSHMCPACFANYKTLIEKQATLELLLCKVCGQAERGKVIVTCSFFYEDHRVHTTHLVETPMGTACSDCYEGWQAQGGGTIT